VPEVFSSPREFNLPVMSLGESKTLALEILAFEEIEPFRIVEIITSPPWVSVLSSAILPTADANKHMVNLNIRPSAPGQHKGSIVVRTNHPKVSLVEVPISVVVLGKEGEKIEILHFGVSKAGMETSKILSVTHSGLKPTSVDCSTTKGVRARVLEVGEIVDGSVAVKMEVYVVTPDKFGPWQKDFKLSMVTSDDNVSEIFVHADGMATIQR
jgi:hypothetical protein